MGKDKNYCDCESPSISGDKCFHCYQKVAPEKLDLLANGVSDAEKEAEEVNASLVETQSRSKNETSEYNLLIQAQNRTTHAVRAFVRFLFIQLSALTMATFLFFISIQLGNEEGAPNTFLLIMGGVIWIIGLVWSSSAGWSELEKSNIKE